MDEEEKEEKWDVKRLLKDGGGSGANIVDESFHVSCKSWSCVSRRTLYDNAILLSTYLLPVNYVIIFLSLLCMEHRLGKSAVKINNAVPSYQLASQSVS